MMGKISAGQDFGQAIAQPMRLNEVALPNAAFGATNALMSAGRVMEAEAFSKEKEAQQAQDAADRARASARLGIARDKLQDLSTQLDADIQSGAVPKADAESVWRERSTQLVQEGIDAIPEAHRGIAQETLTAWQERLNSNVQKSVQVRNQSDTRADLNTTLEHLQRVATANYDLAKQQAGEALDNLGPAAGLSPEQIGKAKQSFIEGASYTRAFTAVNLAKNDNKALTTAEKAIQGNDDLDPQRKAQLLAQIDGYKANNEARAIRAAQRAEIESAKVERESAKAWDVLTTWAAQGKAVDPVASAGLIAKLDPVRAAAWREMAKEGPANTAVAVKPMSVQEQELTALKAQAVKGMSPALEKEIERREKILADQKKAYKDEPLQAGAEYGVIDAPVPVDLSSLDGVAQTFAARVEQAKAVQTRTGEAVSPLMTKEAQALGAMLQSLPPRQQAERIAQFSSVMPADMRQAFAQSLDKTNRALSLAVAIGSSMTTEGRTTGELILRGQQAIKDKSIKEEAGAEFGVKAMIAKEVGDVLSGPTRDAVMDAARYIYLGKQAAGESVSYSGAVRLALGGPVVEHNGRRLAVPEGVDLPTALANYPASRIPAPVYVNGQPIPGEAAAKALPGAQLEPAGKGRFMVRVGGHMVSGADRKPLVIDVTK